MLYETYSGESGSVWSANDETAFPVPDFPFADLSNEEIQQLNPYNYMEWDGWLAFHGVWYPLDVSDDRTWPPSDEESHEGEEGFWFPLDGDRMWLPYPGDGSSVFFVDESETLPFADLSNEELCSLYLKDPLDYVDPWQDEVYDMEYIE